MFKFSEWKTGLKSFKSFKSNAIFFFLITTGYIYNR